jgi:hypothetical protein
MSTRAQLSGCRGAGLVRPTCPLLPAPCSVRISDAVRTGTHPTVHGDSAPAPLPTHPSPPTPPSSTLPPHSPVPWSLQILPQGEISARAMTWGNVTGFWRMQGCLLRRGSACGLGYPHAPGCVRIPARVWYATSPSFGAGGGGAATSADCGKRKGLALLLAALSRSLARLLAHSPAHSSVLCSMHWCPAPLD